MARQKGLEPLALLIAGQRETRIHKKAEQFLNEQVGTVDEAIAGAGDILAEQFNENERCRNVVRQQFRPTSGHHFKGYQRQGRRGSEVQRLFRL